MTHPHPADDDYPNELTPRNLMGEVNPDTWDPEPPADAGTVNLSVKGTVGPDYLGQQTVDVDGHRYDRDPDMTRAHARRLSMRGEFLGLDDDQPLPLLASDMKAGPIEGVQGSYTVVTELGEPCPKCSHAYGVLSRHTLAGVGSEECLACDHTIETH